MTGNPKVTSHKREQRLNDIRSLLMAKGTVSTEEVIGRTGVSRMTAHRDLDELEHRGVLHRTRGGATVERTLLFDASVDYRLSTQQQAKTAIARHAAAFVTPGQILMLDDSTTSHTFLRALPEDMPVTVITNFMPNIELAAARPNTNLIVVGGDYHPSYRSFLGVLTEATLGMLHADLLITSASSLRGSNLFHQSQAVISTRRAMVESSGRRVLLVDSSKIGSTALYLYGNVEDYDDLVVDDGVDPETADSLRELDVRVHIIEPPSAPHDTPPE